MGRYSLAAGLLLTACSGDQATPIPVPEPQPTLQRSAQVPENVIEPRRCAQSFRFEDGMVSVPLACKPYDKRLDAPRPVDKDDLLRIQAQPTYY